MKLLHSKWLIRYNLDKLYVANFFKWHNGKDIGYWPYHYSVELFWWSVLHIMCHKKNNNHIYLWWLYMIYQHYYWIKISTRYVTPKYTWLGMCFQNGLNKEKLAWLGKYFINLPLLSKGSFNGKFKWNFTNSIISNELRGTPYIWLSLIDNLDRSTNCDTNSTSEFSTSWTTIFSLSEEAVFKWAEKYQPPTKIWKISTGTPVKETLSLPSSLRWIWRKLFA